MELHQRVRGYVVEVLEDCATDAIESITRFDSGERHAVFHVTYATTDGAQGEVVVRVATSEEARDCVQATREAAVLDALRGVASPALYDFRCHSQWFDDPTMCVQFIAGEQRHLPSCDVESLGVLGRVVASVHASAIEPLVETLGGPGSAAEYLDSRLEVSKRGLSFSRDPLPAAAQQLVADLWPLVQERAADLERFDVAAATLMHGDISSDNIVWSPEPVLIDWEFARLGDPADEIASMFGQNELTDRQREAFWDGYSQEPHRDVQGLDARTVLWEPVTLFGSALWWVEQWARRADADATGSQDLDAPNSQTYYAENSMRRLRRVHQLLGGAGARRT